jgi:TRAP-type C4-dicarboxylate transport system permease small subunit
MARPRSYSAIDNPQTTFSRKRKKETMEKTTEQNVATQNISSGQLKTQLASYLEQQPEKTRSFHRTMKVLEAIALGIMIIIFITALVLSFMWKTIPAGAIPAAWFLLPTSAAVLMLLIAVHALSLHAYPPSSFYNIYQGGSPARLFGNYQQFVTGKAADIQALILLLVALLVGAFFAIFAWASWTVNWAILTPMINISGAALGIVIAVGIVGGMIVKTYQKLSKSH